MQAGRTFDKLFNEHGELVGVLLSPELWALTEDHVLSHASDKQPPAVVERAEPLNDWKMLQEYWDFRYPVNTEVECAVCGGKTGDWQADSPRKFRLLACNMGGLMRFECCGCKATIAKRHFKDRIKCECTPARQT